MSGIPADILRAAEAAQDAAMKRCVENKLAVGEYPYASGLAKIALDAEIARAILAERERAAKLVEDAPAEVLVMWERPGGPPGNGYRVTTKADIAAAIRKGAA